MPDDITPRVEGPLARGTGRDDAFHAAAGGVRHLGGGTVRVWRVGGPAAVLLGIAALAVGGIFLTLGLALLAGAGLVGAAVGGGWMLWRKLTGRAPLLAPPPRRTLDRSLEVFPADNTRVKRIERE
ncbi:MAG TPA: hypothetical protein VFS05_02375 [Gemmatimonadaceae bacterium]|nr:hypothetical protein [Gemmatimonadaceae bacterium]